MAVIGDQVQEAEHMLSMSLDVKVDVQDLYVDLAYGRPALRAFWDRGGVMWTNRRDEDKSAS